MKNRFETKEFILASLLLAIGILLPMLFHAFGIAGQIFLPMHISVFIAGFVLVPELALMVGLLTPILSSLTTGMPPLFPISIIMMFELGIYGATVSILYRRLKQNIYVSLIVAMIFGRLMAGITVWVMTIGFGVKMNPFFYLKSAILTGLPGIIIQIILIPVIIKALKMSNLSIFKKSFNS
ncbi:ECF transporter S component [Helicovermis profundi]|uniref:ECF transporter S component n=1 Tax=Helicovermis profundi TaxID=3065157 RepID=A0AAU9ET74_9FIRM|nr:ECF transporter S component [Clostridia bacterium S502]